jgi:hypothetical protein
VPNRRSCRSDGSVGGKGAEVPEHRVRVGKILTCLGRMVMVLEDMEREFAQGMHYNWADYAHTLIVRILTGDVVRQVLWALRAFGSVLLVRSTIDMRVVVEGIVTERTEDFVLEGVVGDSHRQAVKSWIFVDLVEGRGLSTVVRGLACRWARNTLSLPCS